MACVFTNIKHSNNHHPPGFIAILLSVSLSVRYFMITVTGKGVNTGNLLRFGRGQYLVALRYMEKSPERSGSNGMMVNYYKRYLARPDSVRYANGATLNDR